MKVQGLGNQTAQEINPYTNFHPVQHPEYIFNKSREKYTRFNEQHPPLPLIDPSGNPVIESGVVEVEKVEQRYMNDNWWNVTNDDGSDEIEVPFRQAYQIVPVTNEADKPQPIDNKVEEAAEKYYWSDEALSLGNSVDRINTAFIAGSNWHSNHPDPDKISRVKVRELINEEIANQKEDQQLCTGMAHIVTNYAISLLTTILNQINQL